MSEDKRKVYGPIAGPFLPQELPELPDNCAYTHMVVAKVSSTSGLKQDKEVWFKSLDDAYDFMSLEGEFFVVKDKEGYYVPV